MPIPNRIARHEMFEVSTYDPANDPWLIGVLPYISVRKSFIELTISVGKETKLFTFCDKSMPLWKRNSSYKLWNLLMVYIVFVRWVYMNHNYLLEFIYMYIYSLVSILWNYSLYIWNEEKETFVINRNRFFLRKSRFLDKCVIL